MLRYGCVCADAVGASVGKCRMVTCVHTHVEFPPRFRMHRAATGNFQHSLSLFKSHPFVTTIPGPVDADVVVCPVVMVW